VHVPYIIPDDKLGTECFSDFYTYPYYTEQVTTHLEMKMFSRLLEIFTDADPKRDARRFTHTAGTKEDFMKDVNQKRQELGLPSFEKPKDPS